MLREPRVLEQAKALGRPIPLPQRVVVATEIGDSVPSAVKDVGNVDADEMILDFDAGFARELGDIVRGASLVVWARPATADRYASVATTNPRGTANPARMSSPRLAPFPPSSSFMSARPSALPPPKK